MKWKMGAALLAVVMLWAAAALGEPAKELTSQCTFIGTPHKGMEQMLDGKYTTRWTAQERTVITITAPEGEKIGGIYLQFYKTGCAFDLQIQNDAGQWEKAAGCDTDYLSGYAQLPNAAAQVRIRAREKNGRLPITEMHVLGEGETPDWVQRWEAPCEDADLLVLVGHPDDEVIFMGGTIPYYAAERNLAVQVAYLAAGTPCRQLELLDGLWLCGVKHYPQISAFPDVYKLSTLELFKVKGWEEARLLRHVTGLLRRYRPEVVVTHDVKGEYGHGVHKAAAYAAQRCVELAADAAYQHQKLTETQPWQVKKLYLHLYEQESLRMDWRVPLEAFGGKTALEMATEAFACHISQQDTEYRVEDFGPYDNACFGLAMSTVGADEAKNDFFEHIAL